MWTLTPVGVLESAALGRLTVERELQTRFINKLINYFGPEKNKNGTLKNKQ